MRQQDPKEYALAESNLAALDKLYGDLDKIATTAEDKGRIATAKTATAEYAQAAREWKANDDALGAILVQMNDIGLKVQDNAQKAEDAGWVATEGMIATAAATSTQAILLTLVAAVAAMVLGR